MRHLVDAHHKVDGKHSIGHIAERAKGADAFPLRVAHAAHLGTAFVGQALAQVEQDVALTFGEGEARHARAHGGSHLGLDAVFGEHVAVVARTGSLIGVFAAIFLIVNGKCAGSRHQQQRAQLGASHTAEVDMGISYTWKGLTVGFNDYYYPTLDGKKDEYFTGGKHTGHWLEACVTYAPEKIPIWITASNFFYGYDKNRIYDSDGNEISAKQAYSTYFEIGAFYDFLNNNRISLAVGTTPDKSCYSDYQKNFAVCNIDLKYTYSVNFKSGWILPLNTEFIYNPVFDKPFINFIVNIVF